MGLKYKFKKAEEIIQKSDPRELERLRDICGEIQGAQHQLLQRAKDMLKRCEMGCEGLCCRNIEIDAIIGLPDFVYILAMERSLRETMATCLERESLFYSSDCIFLEGGIGPCLFPSGIRPEVCVVTFCSDESPARKEIALVKRKFMKLGGFILLRRPRAFKRLLSRMCC